MDKPQAIDIHFEIARFRSFAGMKTLFGTISSNGPDIIKYTPTIKSYKTLKVGFLSLIHGNETIGLPILNTLIQGLLDGVVEADFEILFGMGNLPAVDAEKRFIEKDLNRCFGQSSTETAEDIRAREIEQYMLNEIDYLVDLHQTVHPAATPFFIFQYTSKSCFTHLSMMNAKFPTILQFDAIGDNQSLSTDEYLRSRGRFGVALELGQIGYSDEKFKAGLSVCAQLIRRLKFYDNYIQLNVPYKGSIPFKLFEISSRLSAPADDSLLDDSWSNFAKFKKGQILGTSKSEPILAPQDGCVLFPKLRQNIAKGQSLMFICSELNAERSAELDLS